MLDSEYFLKTCKDFEIERKITITESAQNLLFSTLVAIEEDSHPSWNIKFTQPKEVAEYFSQNLFRFLEEISRVTFIGSRVSLNKSLEKITFFDVFHWVSFRIDSLCPFIKD